MCGIVGITGTRPASPILIEALRRLEYRGYDSAGIATIVNESIERRRSEGKIRDLDALLQRQPMTGTTGIGHTRWATHGIPSEANAHPHSDGRVAVVHNGIIENFQTLRAELETGGIVFTSETDTEVISNLIGYFYNHENCDGKQPANGQNKFEWAVQRTLRELHGTFGLAIICSDYPNMLIGARKGSPLILGVGDNEYILASDAAAIVEHTTSAIYLSDNEMVTVNSDGFRTTTINNIAVSKDLEQIERRTQM